VVDVQTGIIRGRGGIGAARFLTALLKSARLRVGIVLELRGLLCLFAAGMQIDQTLDPGKPLVSGALSRHSVSAEWTNVVEDNSCSLAGSGQQSYVCRSWPEHTAANKAKGGP
jgi:hypothetical protein